MIVLPCRYEQQITKTKPVQPDGRYTPEDLQPRDAAADDRAADAYLERNKDALNASIEKARAEFERGEYFTLDQVMADAKAQKLRRERKP